jgi:hypothetical protein
MSKRTKLNFIFTIAAIVWGTILWRKGNKDIAELVLLFAFIDMVWEIFELSRKRD